jgi:PHD/YefM family antitoxin component YafN of YafNO toxin-antitoxin module
MKLRTALVNALSAILVLASAMLPAAIGAKNQPARLVIVMVWDGLRPDFVTRAETPNLYAMEHEGVDFAHSHALYPTVTMVNAAALATGARPGQTGILGDSMYLAPALGRAGAPILSEPRFGALLSRPLRLEDAPMLARLNGPNAFAGRLLGLDTVAQEVERAGGYLAVVGKEGPAFLWDNRVTAVKNGRDSLMAPHRDYLFATDSLVEPKAIGREIKAAMPPAAARDGVLYAARDDYFTRIVDERAIPAARSAVLAGRPAMVVLWLHNPDITQHVAGLGTAAALAALKNCDDNLGRLRAAVHAAGMDGHTDLVVVSDHGFATIRLTIDLNGMLAAAGLKKSVASRDVVIARNGGSDLVYLSRDDFPTQAERRAELQKIVNFAEAQEWCGVIFSHLSALGEPGVRGVKPYQGWIDGTFSEASVGILSPNRAPDLVISFRELPDTDNRQLTGPLRLAFSIGAKGQHTVRNRSEPLVRPVQGVIYADARGFTTGMGMHGALGPREVHNFCAAIGPDFRSHFVDPYPSGNIDIAPTVTKLLGTLPNVGPGGLYAAGRPLVEAMRTERRSPGVVRPVVMTTRLTLQGVEVISTLRMTRLGDRYYLDGSDQERKPLGSSP